MESFVEVVRVLAGLTPEQFTPLLALAAMAVAALAIHSRR